jgi:hypothetical protein
MTNTKTAIENAKNDNYEPMTNPIEQVRRPHESDTASDLVKSGDIKKRNRDGYELKKLGQNKIMMFEKENRN